MSKSKPLVSIVVLNWNGKTYLKTVLESLEKLAYENFEVILVDNGSTDDSTEYVAKRFPWVVLIRNKENLGCAGGFNTGMEKAKGKYIVNLANDTYVDPHFVEEFVKVMEADPHIGACQCKLILADKKTLDAQGEYMTPFGFLHHRGFLESDKGQFDKVEEVFSGKGTALTFRREVLERVGMFDSDFFTIFEDADLCWRIWLGGYKVVYVPTSIVYHLFGGAIAEKPGIVGSPVKPIFSYLSFRNRIISILKNSSTFNLLKMIPVHIAFCIFVIVDNVKKRRLNYAFGVLNALIWNLVHFRSTYRKRTLIQFVIRRVPDNCFMKRVVKKVSVSVLSFKHIKTSIN